MAKEPTAAAKPIDYVVAFGVLVTKIGKKSVELGVGSPFKPADDEERDSLLAAGRIVPASEAATLVAPADAGAAQAAVIAATARADAADAKVAELEKALADRDVEIATLKAAANPAPATTPAV